MKIAIDIRRITEFGVGTYTRNIIRALTRLDRENEYFLLGSPEKAKEMDDLPENFSSIEVASPETAKGFFQCHSVLAGLGCD
ncbi:MAG TPA: hypothetical protein VJS37_01980, partial [Terriglobales bacterium]|nr:hypothetical protein [Terriglobales bacterium]